MNIGIDIDGVLVDLEKFELTYGTKLCVENGWDIKINLERYLDTEKFNWTEEQENKFWNTYLEKYVTESKPREFAQEIIRKLKEENNKIYIITARNEEGLPPKSYGKMQELTKTWLDKNNIMYDKLIFASDDEKINQCIENDIDVMIEDSPKNILSISSKIPVIKYNCRYNDKITNENIINAYAWYHIYDIINNMEK